MSITRTKEEQIMLSLNLFHHVFVIILFLVCFITFVFVTRGRRPVSNILAWLFFMFLVPYVAIPLFLIIGQRKLTWVLRKKSELFHQTSKELSQKTPIEALLNAFGVLPPTANNKVSLFGDGQQAYQVIMQQM